MMLFVYYGRAVLTDVHCTGLQESTIGMGHYYFISTDGFSIIKEGFAGVVDIVGLLGVLFLASIAELHILSARKSGCGESYVCLVME